MRRLHDGWRIVPTGSRICWSGRFRNAALVSAVFLALAVVFALADQFGRVPARSIRAARP